MAYVVMNKAKVLKCNETGQLAIQTGPGETITPIGAGASGGVSSWNDLTDKPFYSEGEIIDVSVILMSLN